LLGYKPSAALVAFNHTTTAKLILFPQRHSVTACKIIAKKTKKTIALQSGVISPRAVAGSPFTLL
jgi:hypothetical protein